MVDLLRYRLLAIAEHGNCPFTLDCDRPEGCPAIKMRAKSGLCGNEDIHQQCYMVCDFWHECCGVVPEEPWPTRREFQEGKRRWAVDRMWAEGVEDMIRGKA